MSMKRGTPSPRCDMTDIFNVPKNKALMQKNVIFLSKYSSKSEILFKNLEIMSSDA